MTFVGRTGTLSLPMVEKRSGDKLPVRYPEFGRRVDTYMVKMSLTNEDVAEIIGKERGEMVRRYREGKAIPRDEETMRKMATLFRTSAGELHYGDPLVPGVITVPVANVSPDEQIMIEAYRKLPRAAQKAVRARVTELLEEFAPAGEGAPFSRGKRKARR